MIADPPFLLLDEPLGALDRNLREQMQVEMKSLHKEFGITTICVTHDQEEALTLSDRIVVMRAGRIEQTDTPEALYDRPAACFVANFLGEANILENPGFKVESDAKPPSGSVAMIRPERICLAAITASKSGDAHQRQFVTGIASKATSSSCASMSLQGGRSSDPAKRYVSTGYGLTSASLWPEHIRQDRCACFVNSAGCQLG
ncbi:ABC transporter ATP-binding protein [Mesorhizobium sp. LMG 17147]|nr:ABC transporter ATP-binding protein [Mesorhizobium sp. LMG 17147]